MHPLGLGVGWDIERKSLDDLLCHPDQAEPHIVIMGNSIDGGHSDYMTRFGQNAKSKQCRRGDLCPRNEAHVSEFLSTDHDRLALAFFASHKAYAFSVSDQNGDNLDDSEIDVVRKRMYDWARRTGRLGHDEIMTTAQSLMTSWRISQEEADIMGTGAESMRTFAWQHAFLETKARIATRIQHWMEAGELMPLHAPIS